MEALFSGCGYVAQAFIATLFTWSITALGAAVVIFFKKINKMLMNAMLGFAAGVMTAASFWSLLAPSIEMSEALGMSPWLMSASGFLSGGLLLFLGEKIFAGAREREKKTADYNTDHPSTGDQYNGRKKRCAMLIFSITLHNIPEGLAVGVAFGSAACGLDGASLPAAWLLALGIGLQNFPEGAAVSVPLRREGLSRGKAFFYGQLSGAVEPVAGVLGAVLVMRARFLLPFLLAFAAGAMIYVVTTELIPESQSGTRKEVITLLTLVGFSVMMILDVALG